MNEKRNKKTRDHQFPKLEIPAEMMERGFPGGFTVRDEANALAAYAFRNGPLENLHAGKSSPLTEDASLSRITQAEMKELMIEACEKLAYMLNLRQTDPDAYKNFVRVYGAMFCGSWNRE